MSSTTTSTPEQSPPQDWSSKTDFNDITSIGYLCDNGEVIQGDVLRQNSNKIFVHFNTASYHFGSKYTWLDVPNDRISPPPTTRPSQSPFTVPTSFTTSLHSLYANTISPPNTSFTTAQSDEDEDFRRAIAESLGQTYTPSLRRTYDYKYNYKYQHLKKTNEASKDSNANNLSLQEVEYLVAGWWKKECVEYIVPKGIIKLCEKWYFDQTAIEHFIAQPMIKFDDALDILWNKQCCFGVYDFKAKLWRTAVYMNHWEKTRRIMVRYTQEQQCDPNKDYDKFKTLKIFPNNAIMIDKEKFKTTERDLRDMSNVPREKIEAWITRNGGTVRRGRSDNNGNNNGNGGGRNNGNDRNYVNFEDEDRLLQQAIAASLLEQ